MPAARLLYALPDESLAIDVLKALRGAGVEMGSVLEPEPETFLGDPFPTRCVALIWSNNTSSWPETIGEAVAASAEGTLVILRFDHSQEPLTLFPGVDCFELSKKGPGRAKEFDRLVHTVRRMLNAGEVDRPVNAADEGGSSRRHPLSVGGSGGISDDRERGVVFLCYRQDDTADATGRLYERFAATYGRDRVFMDIISNPLGVDFMDRVNEQISRYRALLVVIGPQWLNIKDQHGRRKLDHPEDYVRVEIAAALKQKIPVIPVLVQSAAMPQSEELPEDIRPLSRRHGISLHHAQWDQGVQRLLEALNEVI